MPAGSRGHAVIGYWSGYL